jgi:hypothetical protein
MSVSFSDLVDIFKLSYSKLYGGIDTKYIFITNFIEINPGELAFTCEVLVPSSKRETINKIRDNLNEMDVETDGGTNLFLNKFNQAKQDIVGDVPLTANMLTGFNTPTNMITKRSTPLPVIYIRDNIPPVIVRFDIHGLA